MAEYYENLYPFKPSLALALFGAALFCIIAFLHSYQLLRSRTWLLTAFVIGGYFEVFGFLLRAFSIQERPQYTLPLYAASLALILVAPALFAASMYMFLGRIIRLIQAEHHAIIRVGWLTKLFVLSDIVSFAAQGMGAVILSQQTEESYNRGRNVMTVGLIVQIVFFVFFLITAGLFHFRTNRHLTDRSRHRDIPWKKHMQVLYIASAIILVRCVFRFLEYRLSKPGDEGYLLSNEWPMYVLDSLLMLIVMILVFVKHPSEVTALRKPLGGVAMKYLSGRQAGPINDHWRTLPEPVLDSRFMYGVGEPVRMTQHPPRGVQLAQANSFRA